MPGNAGSQCTLKAPVRDLPFRKSMMEICALITLKSEKPLQQVLKSTMKKTQMILYIKNVLRCILPAAGLLPITPHEGSNADRVKLLLRLQC